MNFYIILHFFYTTFLLLKCILFFFYITLIKKNIKKNSYIIIKNLYKLGPIFLKIGQILGTRENIFTIKTHVLFKNFFNNIIPTKGNFIKNNTFKYFYLKKKHIKKISNIPIAVASISQVYSFYYTKHKFAIKILNKKLQKHLSLDLKILKFYKKILTKLNTKTSKLKKIITQIINILKNEQNLYIEAHNIRKQKKYKQKIYLIQNINFKLSKKNYLTTNFLHGIPLYKLLTLKKIKKIQITKITTTYVKIFFLQLLKNKMFHADMHPGNILIKYTKKKKFKLILIDFGIIGKLKKKEKLFILTNIFAFINKQYKTIINLHINKYNKKLKNLMQQDLYNIWEPITNKTLKTIPLYIIIKKLLFLVKKYKIKLKPEFLLVQKTLLTIDGVCRTLNSDINLWKIIKNIFKKYYCNF